MGLSQGGGAPIARCGLGDRAVSEVADNDQDAVVEMATRAVRRD